VLADNDMMTDNFKRTALDSAVQSILELRQFCITQHTLCWQLNTLPTFEEYFSVVLETAASTTAVYDSQQVLAALKPLIVPPPWLGRLLWPVVMSSTGLTSLWGCNPSGASVADHGYREDFSSSPPPYDDA
jgi:cellulose synthase/poly-beta-1,6-N-acetylglucosamine synthase-like glycosyltransferase